MRNGHRFYLRLAACLLTAAVVFAGAESCQAMTINASPDDAASLENAAVQQSAVIPTGWRRTNAGWEHASTWSLGSSNINDLIAAQRRREPAWIRFFFLKLRSIPPLVVAVMQITAIAVIMRIAEDYRSTVSREP